MQFSSIHTSQVESRRPVWSAESHRYVHSILPYSVQDALYLVWFIMEISMHSLWLVRKFFQMGLVHLETRDKGDVFFMGINSLLLCRSGSLPEILIYLPDEGHFSWVPGSDWIQLAMRKSQTVIMVNIKNIKHQNHLFPRCTLQQVHIWSAHSSEVSH